jgi:hypothetical protein
MAETKDENSMLTCLQGWRSWWESQRGSSDNVHRALTETIKELVPQTQRGMRRKALIKAVEAGDIIEDCAEHYRKEEFDLAVERFDAAFELMKQAHVLLLNDAIGRMDDGGES